MKKVLKGLIFGVIVFSVLFVVEHYFFGEQGILIQAIIAGGIAALLSLLLNKRYRVFHDVVIILTFFILNHFFQDLKFIIGLAIVLVVELVLQAIGKEKHDE